MNRAAAVKLFLFVAFIILSSSCAEAIQTGILRAKRDAASDSDSADPLASSKSYVRLGRISLLPHGDESENKSEYSDQQSTNNDEQELEQELFDPELIDEKHDYGSQNELDLDTEGHESLFNKRGARDRNFVRMGRSDVLGEIYADEHVDKRDGKSYVRMGRDGKSFVRMGKDGKSFVRMGRDGKSFVRMGRDGKSFIRMGKAVDFKDTNSDAIIGSGSDLLEEAKRGDKSFVRMGKSIDIESDDKRADKSYVRMGKSVAFMDNDKRDGKTYVRLGRSFNDDVDKRASSKQYVRFGRNINKDEIDFENFDPKEISKKTKQYVRFG